MGATLQPHATRHRVGEHPGRGPDRMLDLGRVVLGVVAVSIGVLYLLQAADVLDAGEAIADWWPGVVILIGVAQVVERSHGILGPILLIGAGTLMLLVTTDVFEGDVWSYVWPAALVASGVVAIARWAGAGSLPRGVGQDVVVASGIFGGPTIRNVSQTFRGASLTAIFGGVLLDLRGAKPVPGGARITATVVFGGVEILVPRGWRIALRGTPIFGGVEDKTERSDLPYGDAPLLEIDALAAFGGVEIKHDK